MSNLLPTVRRTRRTGGRAAIAAAVACLPMTMLFAPNAVAEPGGGKNIDIVFHYRTDAPTVITPNDCSPKKKNGIDAIKLQDIAYGTDSTDNYRVTGPATDITCGFPNPAGGFDYSGTETGTVTIDGCGTGNLSFFYFDGSSTAPGPDGTGTDSGKVRFDPGSGTGDLKGVSGQGTTQGTTFSDGTTKGVVKATVHCPKA